jgi:threonine/homoserine/homoserine lactone efflux protein
VNFIILFLIGLGTGLSGAMIPGPLFLFTVSESFKKDAAVGLRIAVGHIFIEAIFVTLIFLGFKDSLTSRMFMRVVSGIGGLALVVMGVILLRGAAHMSLAVKEGIDFDYGSFVGGAFFSVISPGFLIWWSTIGLSVVLKSLLFGLMGLAMVALGHWLADVAWHWFISYFLHQKRYYLEDRIYRNILRLLGLGLMGVGIYFGTGVSV